jgi:hypothetical protein
VKVPSILDVVHAVKGVAAAHPEVAVWWYTPPQRLRLAGELPGSGATAPVVEVVVEGDSLASVTSAPSMPCAAIALELTAALSGTPVTVRTHRGTREERHLFRIVSTSRRGASEMDEMKGGL